MEDGFYCRHGRKYGQRHLKEFRAEKKSHTLNVASRLDTRRGWGVRKEDRESAGKETKRGGQKRAHSQNSRAIGEWKAWEREAHELEKIRVGGEKSQDACLDSVMVHVIQESLESSIRSGMLRHHTQIAICP